MSKSRIMATFYGDHTGFIRTFDCTDQINKMSTRELAELTDLDYTSDNLAPEELIEQARAEFTEMWGDGLGNTVFGYGVKVTQEINDYFINYIFNFFTKIVRITFY